MIPLIWDRLIDRKDIRMYLGLGVGEHSELLING